MYSENQEKEIHNFFFKEKISKARRTGESKAQAMFALANSRQQAQACVCVVSYVKPLSRSNKAFGILSKKNGSHEGF